MGPSSSVFDPDSDPPRLPAAPAAVAGAIEAWFEQAARDLPWRRVRTPWRTLVSELMLQQTQVTRVAERFESFMAEFPDPAAMVAAGEDAVLSAWEGMGYYRRARLLHATAVQIVQRHDGMVPDDPAELLALPGVGRYTAGSVSSIAFDLPEPIVDGNVVRVLARLLALDARGDDPRLVAACWRLAAEFVEGSGSPGMANEGLMELGATVCTPARPNCEACPLSNECRARATGMETTLPRPKRRPVRSLVHLDLALVESENRVRLERRPKGGLWGGLWQPPGLESDSALDAATVRTRLIERGIAGVGARIETVAKVRRLLTHREVRLTLWRVESRAGSPADHGDWFDAETAAACGMAKPVRDLLETHAWRTREPG